jgi:DNA-binding MarR family transcriptional regulator
MLEEISGERLDALAKAAEAYVHHAFGQRLVLEPIAPTNVPHFILDRYKLWSGVLNERRLILMAVREPRQGVTADYLKHREVVRQNLRAEIIILLLDKVSAVIRRQMVDRQIGFLAPGAQLYVPEALLDLRERAPAITLVDATDQISPTTQLVILGVLHRLHTSGESLTELAHRFGVAIMSMSRTLDELESLHLAKAELDGRKRLLFMQVAGRELWEAVRDRLHSPVRKVRMVTGNIGAPLAPCAGESALARFTMLAEPKTTTRAVAAANWKSLTERFNLIPASPFDYDREQVETWSYDPNILAQGGIVDRLSLYLSVRETPDERVAEAADELLETFEW